MKKVYCDWCGKEKTKYADLGYKIIISHTIVKDLCRDCFREIVAVIKQYAKLKKNYKK